jgi:plasmid stabilization system protein ParE
MRLSSVSARPRPYTRRDGLFATSFTARAGGGVRIRFDIREDERHIRVLRIWHSSRDAVTAADVEE